MKGQVTRTGRWLADSEEEAPACPPLWRGVDPGRHSLPDLRQRLLGTIAKCRAILKVRNVRYVTPVLLAVQDIDVVVLHYSSDGFRVYVPVQLDSASTWPSIAASASGPPKEPDSPRARHVEGVEREPVVVEPLVVPRRARPIVSGVVAPHLLVPCEPVGVVVDSPYTVAGGARRLSALGNAVRVDALGQLVHVRGDVHQHPVVEVDPRQVVRDRAAFLVHVVGYRGHIRVYYDHGQGSGAGRYARPT